ncbi:transposase [Phormidesmis sp. 146-33]
MISAIVISARIWCAIKATNGIKRHLAVDSLGFPFFTHCTRANVTDDQGLIEMLTQNIDYFRQKPSDLPKATLLLDHGYHPDKLQKALEQVCPEIMTKIEFEVSEKPSKAQKAAQGKSGFVPMAVRWVTERTAL